MVGSSLAEHLLKDKHQLSLIEFEPQACQNISEKLDLQIVTGSGSSPAVLKAAGLAEADMVLAVTPNNEVNIIVCAIAAQYDVPRRIARLRGTDFADAGETVNLEKLGVTNVIRPEKVLAEHIMQFVDTPQAVEAANFEDGRILLRGYRVTNQVGLIDKTPKEIREQIDPHVVLFPALVRDGVGMIPHGSTVIRAGDILYSLFPSESLDTFLKLVGVERSHNSKIIITGDSYTTTELAAALDKTEHNVTLVDPSLEHAEKIAPLFKRIVTIHGDCTDNDLLRDLNVDSAALFIAASDAADYNILAALLAKAEGTKEVIVTTTDATHDKLFHSIGIDHVINPRLTTAHEILEMIARGHIGSVVKLSDVDIEAIRFNVSPDSDVAGTKVAKISHKLKTGSIIGVIVRDDKMILPHGETIIEAGDHVLVVTHHRNVGTLSKLFKPRKIFKRS